MVRFDSYDRIKRRRAVQWENKNMLSTRNSAKYTAEERALRERYAEVRRLKVCLDTVDPNLFRWNRTRRRNLKLKWTN